MIVSMALGSGAFGLRDAPEVEILKIRLNRLEAVLR
jgi:hypothetical protein